MKFIIIEPDADTRRRIKAVLVLGLGNVQVVEVTRFSDATSVVFDNQDAAAVFITNNTPTGRGLSTALEIKSAFPELKVVLTSSHANGDHAKELGLDGFLSEGAFTPAEVRELVRKLAITA